MSGLLVDPNCTGSMQELNDSASDTDAYLNATVPARIQKERDWATRDLDRLQFDGTWGSRI